MTYFKVAPPALDAFPESPPSSHNTFCVFKALNTYTHLYICAHTHTQREFVIARCIKWHSRHKVKLIAHVRHSIAFVTTERDLLRTSIAVRWRSNKHEGQSPVDFNLKRCAEKTTTSYLIARTLLFLLRIFPNRLCPWCLLFFHHSHSDTCTV